MPHGISALENASIMRRPPVEIQRKDSFRIVLSLMTSTGIGSSEREMFVTPKPSGTYAWDDGIK
jgi:hypothetical protein